MPFFREFFILPVRANSKNRCSLDRIDSTELSALPLLEELAVFKSPTHAAVAMFAFQCTLAALLSRANFTGEARGGGLGADGHRMHESTREGVV